MGIGQELKDTAEKMSNRYFSETRYTGGPPPNGGAYKQSLLAARQHLERQIQDACSEFTEATGLDVTQIDVSTSKDPAKASITYIVQVLAELS